jgi:hypothetical protein
MSSLSPQQINQSYAGLIKLSDSTTGITETLQTMQDGLGNDLPMKINNDKIQSQNLFSFDYYTPDYEGVGFTTTASAFPALSQNVLIAQPFYNSGINSFSGMTYRLFTGGTTSDTVEVAFYTTQFIPGLGLQPKDLVMSGISLDTTTAGTKSTTLPSTLSFSAYGSGIYYMVLKVTNSGVTPTIRYTTYQGIGLDTIWASQLGFVFDAVGTQMLKFSKTSGSAFNGASIYTSLNTFKTSFVEADFSAGVRSATYAGIGFVLNVIK